MLGRGHSRGPRHPVSVVVKTAKLSLAHLGTGAIASSATHDEGGDAWLKYGECDSWPHPRRSS